MHAICDNYKTHKTKEVQAWLAKHPRFKLHFTPTSSSWIDLVSGCSPKSPASESTAAYSRASRLKAAIETWLTERNTEPKPSKWTAKANNILEKMHVPALLWRGRRRRVLNVRVQVERCTFQ